MQQFYDPLAAVARLFTLRREHTDAKFPKVAQAALCGVLDSHFHLSGHDHVALRPYERNRPARCNSTDTAK